MTAQTSRQAALAATEEDVLDLSRTALIGTFGSDADRRALIRLPSGQITQVTPGDRIQGDTVTEIGAGVLILTQRNGQRRALALPGAG